MIRTLALGGRKSPAELFVEQGGRLQDFTYMNGQETGTFADVRDQMIRLFEVSIESNLEFRKALRAAFEKGFQEQGKGAVIAVPIREADQQGFVPLYAPQEELSQALGVDEQSRSFQQLLSIVDVCKPESQIAVVAVDEGVLTGASFKYHSYLLNIGKEVL